MKVFSNFNKKEKGLNIIETLNKKGFILGCIQNFKKVFNYLKHEIKNVCYLNFMSKIIRYLIL